MSPIQIPVALVVSGLLAVASLSLAADRGESTPRGDRDAATEPEPETVRRCKTAIFGDLIPGWRKRAVVAGPVALVPGERNFGPPGLFGPDAVIKVLAVVDARARVTLAVPEAERQRLSLLYDFGPGPSRDIRFSDGTSSVRFRACSRSGAEYPGPGGYPGRETQFNGLFFVRGAHCAAIEVWTEGRTNPRRRWLPFGVSERRCPPRRA
ncbi:MAG: hypothetical protein K0R88_140 [Solirubrobacterales bacterium]|jgi:hypothetical protein|nr:hypothetical protein [Solirubrobacterales bacterium]